MSCDRGRSRASFVRKVQVATGRTCSACTTTSCDGSTTVGATQPAVTSRWRAPAAPRCSPFRRSPASSSGVVAGRGLHCRRVRSSAVRHAGLAVLDRSGRRARCARPGRGGRCAGRRAPRAEAATGRRRSHARGRRISPKRGRSRCSRSARRRGAQQQRAAILDRVRAGRLSVLSIHSATDSCYAWPDYGAARGRPLRRSPVDADVHRRRARHRASGVRAPRHRVEVARRGVPVPRSAIRRASTAACARRRARPERRRCAPARVRISARVVLRRRAGAACSRRASAISPARGRRRRTCNTSRAAWAGRSTTSEQAPQLLQLGVLAAAARGRGRRRSVPARRSRRAARAVARRACASGSLTMLGPEPEPVPLDLETTETVDCGSYRRERVVFDTESTMSVPAYLLVPARSHRAGPGDPRDPRPRSGQGAHLRVLDEEARRRRAVRARARERRVTSCSRPTCAASASAATGCPTTSTTATGISCARRWRASCRTSATCGISNARSTCSPRIRSSTPQRLGAGGLSYGATCTLFLAAIDERVRAAIVACYLSSWRSAHTIPFNMCGSQILPGQIGALEHLDIASLDRAACAARRERDRGHHLSGRRRARDGRVAAPRLRRARRARRRARARRVRRWPHVARHRDPGLPGEVVMTIGATRRVGPDVARPVPAARSARRGRRARRPGAHVGSAARATTTACS